MKRNYVDPSELVSWIKENFDLGEIIDQLGKDEVIDELGSRAIRARLGTDLLDEFKADEVREHFGFSERDEDYAS